MKPKLKFWRFYPNPIRRHNFSLIRWGLTQTWGKLRDALTIVQTREIADRIEVYEEYDRLYESGRIDFPTVALIEEMVASDITEALRAEGIRVFPPVVFKAYLTPKILVVSPRHAIGRIDLTPMFDPNLTEEQREEIERFVEEQDPSLRAYVANLGGIALFPPIVHLYPSQVLVEVAAHEWCHTYFMFSPLGIYYLLPGGATAAINEIVCTLVGKEIVRRVGAKYGWEKPEAAPKSRGTPDYGETLRSIRVEVDELLRLGRVEDVEEFMRESTARVRQIWPKHEELNQAFFAFHGKYGGPAAGEDPTARQLAELRQKAGSLKSFLKLVRGVRSPEGLRQILEDNGIA